MSQQSTRNHEPQTANVEVGTPNPKNGYRRAIATALAAISLTVLLYATVLILTAGLELSRDRAIVLAIFLGLHTFALTILTGDSPWPHLIHLLRPTPPPPDDTLPNN
ncbi:MAG: hypothetical protein AB7R89_33775 [Dehalococcoidia bacterium]